MCYFPEVDRCLYANSRKTRAHFVVHFRSSHSRTKPITMGGGSSGRWIYLESKAEDLSSIAIYNKVRFVIVLIVNDHFSIV